MSILFCEAGILTGPDRQSIAIDPMQHPALKKNSLSLYFTIAYALPLAAVAIVTLTAGIPTVLVAREISTGALVVVMAMVHAPTIAATIVVFRSQRFKGIKTLFLQLRHWKFAPQWYLKAIVIFPAAMLAVLVLLSLASVSFTPVFSLSVMAFGALFSALWEEIGWTGFATPVMLKRFSPLNVGLLLGLVHAMWHLPASLYGSGAFPGNLFIVNFFVASIGIVGLRIVMIWIYTRTKSLVLAWLMHASFTGGQLLFDSHELTTHPGRTAGR